MLHIDTPYTLATALASLDPFNNPKAAERFAFQLFKRNSTRR